MYTSKQRIAIAQDVIAQIKAKSYRPKRGSFIQLADKLDKEVSELFLQDAPDSVLSEKQAQHALQNLVTKEKYCHVCAVGSAMLSAIKLYDSCALDVSEDTDQIIDHLDTVFGRQNTVKMEMAYELGNGFFEYLDDGFGNMFISGMGREESITNEEAEKAIAFGKRYKSNESRLLAIMKNVIKNKGNFIPA